MRNLPRVKASKRYSGGEDQSLWVQRMETYYSSWKDPSINKDFTPGHFFRKRSLICKKKKKSERNISTVTTTLLNRLKETGRKHQPSDGQNITRGRRAHTNICEEEEDCWCQCDNLPGHPPVVRRCGTWVWRLEGRTSEHLSKTHKKSIICRMFIRKKVTMTKN